VDQFRSDSEKSFLKEHFTFHDLRSTTQSFWKLCDRACAFTVVYGKEDLVLCFGMFTLSLLGVILINIGARGE
jgi:hypothetical protein